LWRSRRKLQKLEAEVSGMQTIQRAKAILMQGQQISEDEAHSTIRQQAMSKRTSMEDMAIAGLRSCKLAGCHFGQEHHAVEGDNRPEDALIARVSGAILA